MAKSTTTKIITTKMPTADATTTDHSQLLPRIFTTAQTAMMGAFMSICKPSTTTNCTCVTSLDERVIRLAVEKRLISAMEKLCTLS